MHDGVTASKGQQEQYQPSSAGPHDHLLIRSCTDELIPLLLPPDFRLGAMSRHDKRRIIEGVQPGTDGSLNRVEISAPKIGSADAATKQGIAGQDDTAFRNMKTHGTRRMARRMKSNRCHVADRHLLFVLEPVVRRWNGHARSEEVIKMG